MATIKIKCWVSEKAALAAGLTEAGELERDVTPELLELLTVEQRQLLREVHCIGGEVRYKGSWMHATFPIPDTSDASVVEWLRYAETVIAAERAERAVREAKAQQESEQDAERAHAWAALPLSERASLDGVVVGAEYRWQHVPIRKTVPDAWQEAEDESLRLKREQLAEEQRERAERREREAAELRAWIAEHAPDMLERFDDGFLPAGATELHDRMADVVFAALDAEGVPYTPIEDDDIEHSEDCCYQESEYRSEEASGLSRLEYEMLKTLRRAAPVGATVQPRLHTARCGSCAESVVYRTGAVATMTVAGVKLRREFAL
jgi:hypothetical protein